MFTTDAPEIRHLVRCDSCSTDVVLGTQTSIRRIAEAIVVHDRSGRPEWSESIVANVLAHAIGWRQVGDDEHRCPLCLEQNAHPRSERAHHARAK